MHPSCYRCGDWLVTKGGELVCPNNCEPRRRVATMPQVDPELERLLAEEEEIERREGDRKKAQRTLRLTELDFLRLMADCKDDSVRRQMRSFYDSNRIDVVGIGVNIEVVY